MREILNRKIKEGDLVVVKGTGRYNLGLRMGIVYGKSVRFCGTDYASYNSCALIENPSKAELKHKQDIIDDISECEKEKAVKADRKAIGKKDLVIGQVYDNNDIYCGKVRVTVEYDKDSGFPSLTEVKEGYGYIPSYQYDSLKQDISYMNNVIMTKNPRKHYIADDGNFIDFPSKLEKNYVRPESVNRWSRHRMLDWHNECYVIKVTVEFLDIEGKGEINVNVSR